MALAIRILWGLIGLTRFFLAVASLAAPAIAALFALSGVLLVAAALRRSTVALLMGVAFAIGGPLAVGLTGLEAFDIRHHLVRWSSWRPCWWAGS